MYYFCCCFDLRRDFTWNDVTLWLIKQWQKCVLDMRSIKVGWSNAVYYYERENKTSLLQMYAYETIVF